MDLEALFQATSDMIQSVRSDGSFAYVNPAWQRTLGYTQDDLQRIRLMDIVHRDCRQQYAELSERALSGHPLPRIETTFVTNSGGSIAVEGSVTIYRETGEAVRTQGIFRDISERRRDLAELGRFFDLSLDMLCVGSADGYFRRVNPRFEQILGYSQQELLAQPLLEFVHEDDRAATLTELEKLNKGVDSVNFQNRYRCRDGSYRWFQWSVPAQAADSQLLFGIARDVTESRRVDEAIDRLAAIVESSDDAIISASLDGHITSWNRGAEGVFGYTSDEAIGRHLSMLTSPDIHQPASEMLERLAAGETVVGLETERIRKDGQRVHISVTASPLRNRSGEVIGVSGIARDITELKMAQAELRRAKEAAEAASHAKGSFLANMSHEIRTPMNAIIGMTHLTLETQLDAEQREYLETVQQSAESLLTIINDVLDFSKVEAGMLELEKIDFDLRVTLADALRALVVKAQQKRLQLAWNVAPAIPDALIGAPQRLRQIIVNLVSNAIKFTDAGEVMIDVRLQSRTEHQVCLHFAISDTGVGIPAAKQPLIFDAFTQVDSSTTRAHGGTGLGLAISSKLAQLMGGSMWLESTMGRGSTFHFTVRFEVQKLPHAASSKPSGREPVADRPVHLLVAEDHSINQLLIKRLLEKRGHQVHLVSNGAAAVRAWEEGQFDVVLMDVQMPEMDGLEAARRIRSREVDTQQHVPIIALTAHAMKGDREKCLAAGMDDYVAKPIDPEMLIQKLQDHVPRPRSDAAGMTAVTAGQVFDIQKAAERVDGDFELLKELAELFLADYPDLLSTLSTAVHRGESKQAEFAAHRLKSGVGNFCAERAFDAALALEVAGRSGKISHLESTLADFQAELDVFVPQLRQFAQQVQ